MFDLRTFVKQTAALVPSKWAIDAGACSDKQLVDWYQRMLPRSKEDIDVLWETYTTGRAQLSPKTIAAKRTVVAYMLGFHPFQWLRSHEVLRRSMVRHPELSEKFRAGYDCIDLGCGTGAVSQAAEELLGAPGSWLGVDISKPALQVASLGSNAARKKTVRISLQEFDLKRDLQASTRPLLICLGYTANEMRGLRGEKFFQKMLQLIAMQKSQRTICLLWLEPATKMQSLWMHKAREQALENDLYAMYPCPHQKKCPMIHDTDKPGEQRDRCYSEVGLKTSKKLPGLFVHNARSIHRNLLGVAGYVFHNQADTGTAHESAEHGVLVGKPLNRNKNESALVCTKDGELSKKPGASGSLRGQFFS